jgi:hypothetical protein
VRGRAKGQYTLDKAATVTIFGVNWEAVVCNVHRIFLSPLLTVKNFSGQKFSEIVGGWFENQGPRGRVDLGQLQTQE